MPPFENGTRFCLCLKPCRSSLEPCSVCIFCFLLCCTSFCASHSWPGSRFCMLPPLDTHTCGRSCSWLPRVLSAPTLGLKGLSNPFAFLQWCPSRAWLYLTVVALGASSVRGKFKRTSQGCKQQHRIMENPPDAGHTPPMRQQANQTNHSKSHTLVQLPSGVVPTRAVSRRTGCPLRPRFLIEDDDRRPHNKSTRAALCRKPSTGLSAKSHDSSSRMTTVDAKI